MISEAPAPIRIPAANNAAANSLVFIIAIPLRHVNYERNYFPLRLASIVSQIFAATSGPPSRAMARMPVGEVTLISVRLPSITSMPTNNNPRSRRRGASVAQISRSRSESSVAWAAPPDHVGAQIVRRRHAVDRAGEFAVDQDDALVAMFDLGKKTAGSPRAP